MSDENYHIWIYNTERNLRKVKKARKIIKRIISILVLICVAIGTFFFDFVSSIVPWLKEPQIGGLAFFFDFKLFKINT